MLKNIFRLAFLLTLLPISLMAQSDKQVINYIKQRHEAGVDQTVIYSELVARGVTNEQLQRIQSQIGLTDHVVLPAGTFLDDRGRSLTEESVPQPAAVGNSQVFGHDIFSSKSVSFEPNMNLPTPQDYILGAGDNLIIDVYGDSQTSQSYTVSPDGVIVVDGCGPISVAGLSIEQATKRIKSKIGSLYGKSSIRISLGQTRSIKVMVMGEVSTPGSYTVSSFATVFHALYLAGGINPIGSMRNVALYRNSKQVSSIDVYDYILNGKMEGNLILQEGDVIMVSPFSSLVSIGGEVKRPMKYEMKAQETLADLLRYAGGTTGKAHTDLIRIERTAGAQRSVHSVTPSNQASFLLMDGDSVYIEGNREDRYENMVDVRGAVFRPGHYQLGPQLSGIRQLVENAGGLDEQSFAANAVLYRMQADRTLKAIKVDIDAIMAGSSADMKLENEDQLFIPSRGQIIAGHEVSIYGEVYIPGSFAFAEGETIEDLIVRAGGLKESASAMKAEVARRKFNPLATTIEDSDIETFEVNICDGLINTQGQASGFVLKPFDIVYIRRSPMSRGVRSVNIQGEVAFAGNYPLADHNQRLSDLMQQAGGATHLAYINNARLIRMRTAEEIAVAEEAARRARLNKDDSVSVYRINISPTYQVGIHLAKALDNPGSEEDLLLRDGDVLIIPEQNNIISVGGEVLTPNTLRFRQGKRAKYYIREAGGYTQKAKKRKAYVVYPNGINDRARKAKLEPGCQILVPTQREKERSFEKTTRIVSISTSFITACAVIVSLLR